MLTVGPTIYSVDWTTKESSTLGEGRQMLCTLVDLDNGEQGVFFMSGELYNLNTETWTSFSPPPPAFNLVTFNGNPVILGKAFQVFWLLE